MLVRTVIGPGTVLVDTRITSDYMKLQNFKLQLDSDCNPRFEDSAITVSLSPKGSFPQCSSSGAYPVTELVGKATCVGSTRVVKKSLSYSYSRRLWSSLTALGCKWFSAEGAASKWQCRFQVGSLAYIHAGLVTTGTSHHQCRGPQAVKQ